METNKEIIQVQEMVKHMKTVQQNLSAVLTNYAVPEPSIVGKLRKSGIDLDYVGHAEITRILIEIDPMWSWEPAAFIDGVPAIHFHDALVPRKGQDPMPVRMASMWGTLHLLGASRVAVGSCEAHKPDLHKELVSDFLRNAAMRFGIALSLWSKQEWEETTETPVASKPVSKPAPKTPSQFEEPKVQTESDGTLSSDQVSQFFIACATKKIDPKKVASLAGVQDLDNIKATDLARLRVAFKELQNSAK